MANICIKAYPSSIPLHIVDILSESLSGNLKKKQPSPYFPMAAT